MRQDTRAVVVDPDIVVDTVIDTAVDILVDTAASAGTALAWDTWKAEKQILRVNTTVYSRELSQE